MLLLFCHAQTPHTKYYAKIEKNIYLYFVSLACITY